jgi:hypothetical protein
MGFLPVILMGVYVPLYLETKLKTSTLVFEDLKSVLS